MTLPEVMAFIHRTSWQGSRLGLERITELMRRLGDPQRELRFIHVAGSNGKGSVCAMLSAILTESGYRTGLYTSPHLCRLNERMQIDGLEISDEGLIALAGAVRPAADALEDPPAEFELITAMALVYFQRQKCDFVVLEVGLGGRLDATNVIPAPESAVIMNIALEHTEILGNTIAKIAAEKAGILKPGTDAVLYHQSVEAEDVIRQKCAACGGILTVTEPTCQTLRTECLDGQVFDYRARKNLRLGLLGPYQCANAAAALDAAELLLRHGFVIPEGAIRRALERVRWPGRFEVLRRAPLFVVDGAHNPNGAEELANCLRRYLPGRKLTLLMGVMADKDYPAMLRTMAPFAERFVTVTPENSRALPAEALRRQIEEVCGLPAVCAGSVSKGVVLAQELASTDGAVCAFGSLYQVGEVRAAFGL